MASGLYFRLVPFPISCRTRRSAPFHRRTREIRPLYTHHLMLRFLEGPWALLPLVSLRRATTRPLAVTFLQFRRVPEYPQSKAPAIFISTLCFPQDLGLRTAGLSPSSATAFPITR